jgi:hypothetical protein
MLDKWIKDLEPISLLEIGMYTAIVIVSLLTCYLVGVSIFVTGTPWNAAITDNVLNWLQLIAITVVIIELDKIRTYCCDMKKTFIKKKR